MGNGCVRKLGTTLAGLSLSLAPALAAGAATLVMSTDKATYAVGETIQMTVTGDSEGGGRTPTSSAASSTTRGACRPTAGRARTC